MIRRPRVEGEVTRHFAGVIQAYDAGVARAEGYVIVYDEKDARYVRRVERRTRIFRLADPSRIINVVPEDVDLDQLKSPATEEGRSVVTDGGERRMELSGFHDKR